MLWKKVWLAMHYQQQQRLDVQFNLGQVYLALNQYQQALTVLKPWIAQNQSPSAHDNLLLAQLYSQLQAI